MLFSKAQLTQRSPSQNNHDVLLNLRFCRAGFIAQRNDSSLNPSRSSAAWVEDSCRPVSKRKCESAEKHGRRSEMLFHLS